MQAEKACTDGDRDWSDATTRQETPAATGKLEEARNGFSPGAYRERVDLPSNIDFGLLDSELLKLVF